MQRAMEKKDSRHKKKYDWGLFFIFIPGLLFYIIFRYIPLGGLVIVFQKFSPFLGFTKSPWVGLAHFERLFSSNEFFRLFRNTISIGFLNLLFTFPASVLFAVILNEIGNKHFKKIFQTVSYFPSFLSVVVVVSIVMDVVALDGSINRILKFFGQNPIHFIVNPNWFYTLYVASSIWAGTGAGAIIFLAALSGINPELYESAEIDGCSRFKMIWYITLPSILPTIMTVLILQSANIFRVGQDKVLLLYNPMTIQVADVFASFVYRQGIAGMNYSYAAAAGLFESIVAGVILWFTNFLSKKVTQQSLW